MSFANGESSTGSRGASSARSASARHAWTPGGRRAPPSSARPGRPGPRSRIAAWSDSSVRLRQHVDADARAGSSRPASRAPTAREALGASAPRRRCATSRSARSATTSQSAYASYHSSIVNSGLCFGRDALVAEVLADLVDALQAADDQALEVELGGDAQVHRRVERVEVRHERARQCAAVDRLQDRGLDLDEALVVEEAADRGDDLGARDEDLARLRLEIRSSSR